jgi:hypothetical protein
MKILAIAFMLLGSLSIICNKKSGDSYAEFQKGWGLEGRSAILVGRLISIFGGLMLVAIGLLIVLR